MTQFKFQIVLEYLYLYISENKSTQNKKIPSERYISKELNVSRTTVKYAIDKLIDERVLYKVHGKGTYITPETSIAKIQIAKHEPDAFNLNVRSKGLEPKSFVLSFKVLYDYKELNHIFPNQIDEFYELMRIRIINNSPFSIEKCYFPFRTFSDANRYDFSKNSLYAYMESKNRNPIYFLKSIEVVHNSKMSNILHLNPITPLFYQTYQGSDYSGRLVEYTKSYSSSQNLKFGFEVSKNNEITPK